MMRDLRDALLAWMAFAILFAIGCAIYDLPVHGLTGFGIDMIACAVWLWSLAAFGFYAANIGQFAEAVVAKVRK